MEDKENINKTPSKMARIAWPKAKYGVILAIIIIITVNTSERFFVSRKKLNILYSNLASIKKHIKICAEAPYSPLKKYPGIKTNFIP